MSAPMHELVGTATARLRGYPSLTALVGTSIYYRPPPTLTAPYVTVDDAYSIRDDAQCVDGLKITLNVHVWTDDSHPIPTGAGGALQDARKIAFEVATALHHFPLALPTNRLVTMAHTGDRIFYDADGVTGHGVIGFEAYVES